MTYYQELSSSHVFSHAPTSSGIWEVSAIVVDSSNNSYALGYFSAGSSLTFGCTGSLVNNAYTQNDVFLVKFDDAGDCVWQISWGDNASSTTSATTSYEAVDLSMTPNDTVVAAVNKIYHPFGPGMGAHGMEVSEYSGAGAQVWYQTFGGITGEPKAFTALASGADDALVAVGWHTTDFSFAGASLPDPSASGYGDDVFVLAWEGRSGSSRTEDWGLSFGGTGTNRPTDVAIDRYDSFNRDISVVGNYDDEHYDASSSAGNTTTTSSLFIQTLESDGTPIASLTSNMSGTDYAEVTSTAFDTDSELYVAGMFKGNIINSGGLQVGFGAVTKASKAEDWFVIKYNDTSLGGIGASSTSDLDTNERINGISAPLNNALMVAGEVCDTSECVPSGFSHLLSGSLPGATTYAGNVITYGTENYRFKDVFTTFYSGELRAYLTGQAKGTSINLGGGTLPGGFDLVACYEISP